MPIINTDNALFQDTVNQRGHRLFTPLVIVGGRLSIPPGTIIDFLSSTLLFPGFFLDGLLNANIVAGATLANPNTVPTAASTVERSLIASSGLCSILYGVYGTILSSLSCTLDAGFYQNLLSGIYDSETCTIVCSPTGTGGMIRNGIMNSLDSDLTKAAGSTGFFVRAGVFNTFDGDIAIGANATGNMASVGIFNTQVGDILIPASHPGSITGAGIMNSSTSTLTLAATTGMLAYSGIYNSSASSITGSTPGPTNLNLNLGIFDCTTCTIDNTATNVGAVLSGCGLYDSNTCDIIVGAAATGVCQKNVVTGSASSELRQLGAADFTQNSISGSNLCIIEKAVGSTGALSNSAIQSSLSSTITASGAGTIDKTSISNSDTCTVSSTADMDTCAIIDGRSSTVSTTSTGDLETSAVINSASSTLRSRGTATCSQNTILSSATSDLSTGVAASGAITNSVIIASNAGTMTTSSAGSIDKSGIICSETCNITVTDNLDNCDIIGSNACGITLTSTGDLPSSGIMNSLTCTITNGGTSASGGRNDILGSNTSDIIVGAAATGFIQQSGIYNSQASLITVPAGAPGQINACGLYNCQNACTLQTGATNGLLLTSGCMNCSTCTITGQCPGPTNLNFDLGTFCSSLCTINNAATNVAGYMRDVFIAASNSSDITGDAAHILENRELSIVGCSGCDIASNGDAQLQNSGFLNSASSTITETVGFNGTIGEHCVIASRTGTVNRNANGTNQDCALIGTITSTLTSTNQTVIAGATGALASGTTNCLLSGLNPSVTGFTNVLAHGATATASNQAIFGTDLEITGATNNITVASGYVRSDKSFAKPALGTATGLTLAETHDHVHITATTVQTITIPTAASIAAIYPAASYRTFLISQAVTATPGRLLLSGADTFRNKTGWTELQLPRSRAPIELAWINTGTPHWGFSHPILLEATANMTTDNNFGVGPPQANASILPTAANRAAHEALTTTAYVTYDTLVSDNPTTFTQTGAVITLVHTGWYRLRYGFNITQADAVPAATAYTLRTDVNNITGAAPIGNSYAEFAGMNDISGSRYIEVTTDKFLAVASNQIAVRISQDTTNTIDANAHVIFSKLVIEAEI